MTAGSLDVSDASLHMADVSLRWRAPSVDGRGDARPSAPVRQRGAGISLGSRRLGVKGARVFVNGGHALSLRRGASVDQARVVPLGSTVAMATATSRPRPR